MIRLDNIIFILLTIQANSVRPGAIIFFFLSPHSRGPATSLVSLAISEMGCGRDGKERGRCQKLRLIIAPRNRNFVVRSSIKRCQICIGSSFMGCVLEGEFGGWTHSTVCGEMRLIVARLIP